MLDKHNLENRTAPQITAKERIDTRLWHAIPLREATINAIVHNDYTNEITPKFEIFADRIEITSAGGLPEGLSKQEFFEGFSVPRNKELMRIFKDLELVEQLGSGIPRILEHYGKESFSFPDNFLRMTFIAKEVADESTIRDDNKEVGQIIGQLMLTRNAFASQNDFCSPCICDDIGEGDEIIFICRNRQPSR